MSMMCKMTDECIANEGLCIHEKMILAIMMLAIVAAIAHWGLNLF